MSSMSRIQAEYLCFSESILLDIAVPGDCKVQSNEGELRFISTRVLQGR